jgi:nickel/cobalt exporter
VSVPGSRQLRRSRPETRGIRALPRRVATVTFVGLLCLLPAAAAQAHPLGNFTVNQSSNIRVQTDHILVDHVLDMAEIPTLQERQRIDRDGNGTLSAAETTAYESDACRTRAAGLHLDVNGTARPLEVISSHLQFPPGQAGLVTLRLICGLRSAEGIPSDGTATVTLRTTLDDGRVGWREMTAVGDGTTLIGSTLPTRSPSNRLTRYPKDLLTNPLDVRSASVQARPGGDRVAAISVDGPLIALPRGIDGPTAWFESLVSRKDLGIGLTIGALALSLLLGGIHAMSPGHGKTVMAAYLVGQNGTWRTVSLIGLTVTLTHTAGVLLLGVLISSSVTLAPERIYPLLGLSTGILVIGFGLLLLRNRIRTRRAVIAALGSHGRAHDHDHDPNHADRSDEPDGGAVQSAQPVAPDQAQRQAGSVAVLEKASGPGGTFAHTHGGSTHTHAPIIAADGTVSRKGLLALGFADGLVPSPSALVVLLGAISLQRAWFGVVLVLGYGVGMALTLVAVGLLLGRLRDRFIRRRPIGRIRQVLSVLPVATAVVIVVVGVYLTARGAQQLGSL